MGNRVAFIVGNSSYKNSTKLPLIRYAENDARAVYKALCTGNGLFDDTHSEMLININKVEFENKIQSFIRKRSFNDFVLFYFAGHGLVVKGNRYYIAMVDTLHGENLITTTAINIEGIIPYLDEVGIDKYVFILDSCRSGLAMEVGGIRNRNIREKHHLEFDEKASGKIIISASEGYEDAIETDKLKHGVFTYYFLRAFQEEGVVKNSSKFIDLRSVYQYIYINMRQSKLNVVQTPVYSSQYEKGQLYIARNIYFTKDTVFNQKKNNERINNFEWSDTSLIDVQLGVFSSIRKRIILFRLFSVRTYNFILLTALTIVWVYVVYVQLGYSTLLDVIGFSSFVLQFLSSITIFVVLFVKALKSKQGSISRCLNFILNVNGNLARLLKELVGRIDTLLFQIIKVKKGLIDQRCKTISNKNYNDSDSKIRSIESYIEILNDKKLTLSNSNSVIMDIEKQMEDCVIIFQNEHNKPNTIILKRLVIEMIYIEVYLYRLQSCSSNELIAGVESIVNRLNQINRNMSKLSLVGPAAKHSHS